MGCEVSVDCRCNYEVRLWALHLDYTLRTMSLTNYEQSHGKDGKEQPQFLTSWWYNVPITFTIHVTQEESIEDSRIELAMDTDVPMGLGNFTTVQIRPQDYSASLVTFSAKEIRTGISISDPTFIKIAASDLTDLQSYIMGISYVAKEPEDLSDSVYKFALVIKSLDKDRIISRSIWTCHMVRPFLVKSCTSAVVRAKTTAAKRIAVLQLESKICGVDPQVHNIEWVAPDSAGPETDFEFLYQPEFPFQLCGAYRFAMQLTMLSAETGSGSVNGGLIIHWSQGQDTRVIESYYPL